MIKNNKMKSGFIYCFSFWFDIFRGVSILLFVLINLYFVFPEVPGINFSGYINEELLFDIIVNILFFSFLLFLVFFILKVLISWIFIGWVKKVNVKRGYQFRFNDGYFIKWIAFVELEIDVVRDATRISFNDLSNRPIYKTTPRKVIDEVVVFRIPKREIKDALQCNKKIWLNIKFFKYLKFNRCFNV